MKGKNKFTISLLVIVMFIQWNIHPEVLSSESIPSYAKAAADITVSDLKDIYLSMENVPDTDYQKYLSRYETECYLGDTITYLDKKLYPGDIIVEECHAVDLTIEVPATALYVLSFDYCTLGDNILQTKMGLKVNGAYSYDELKRLFLSDSWLTGEMEQDRYGNECVSMPVKEKVWGISYLHDTGFLFSDPMMLYLKKGANTLTFEAVEGSFQLGNLYLSGPQVISEDPEENAAGDQVIVIEAEDITYRNSPNIRADSEYNTQLTPYDPKKKLLNVVSEASFKTGGTWIAYEFEIPKEGCYHLAFDYRQSTKSDFKVYRNIYIDGKNPSKAYKNFAFPYARKYTRISVPAPVYLTEGRHLLTIEVSLDYMRDAINILDRITKEINELALSVNKITGGNTNKYRDFDLEAYGFSVEEKLRNWADIIDQVHGALSSLNPEVNNVGEISQLKIASSSLRRLAETPNELPQKLNQFSYGTSSVRQNLTNVISNINVSQLGLDKILFYQDNAELPKKISLLTSLQLNLEHFFASFGSQDYAPDYDKDKDTLQIWVARPRQYLEIMQRMADSDFTKKYGINVDLAIVPDQQKLILANASGKAPDAAIGISSANVYDLALRDALSNMRNFDNFKEVANRFAPGMLIPGICDNGVYAMPETFNFYVLFYRTDILESLGLSVPDTMDEVRTMLPELERMGLSFNTHIANSTVKDFAATTPFIFQSGGSLVKNGEMTANLDSPEVINGLKYLTENFTIYDMEYEVLSFYQQFRDGRMPIGVSNYATFNLLINAAPEIADCWDIAPYPGLVKEDGSVLRYTSGAAESCIVFRSSENPEGAWKFIDWWTSTEVQTEFAYTLQSTLGNEYLWNSANLDAIMASPWSTKHKDVILEQISWTYEAPKLPGSYIIERELGNILVNVVTKGTNLRTAVDDAEKKINRELQRKLVEFGYMDRNGNILKELTVPDMEMVKEWLK